MNSLFYMLPIFAACLVEAVEAFTIVLAAGTRSWRASMAGTAVALAVLGVGIQGGEPGVPLQISGPVGPHLVRENVRVEVNNHAVSLGLLEAVVNSFP